MPPFASFFCLFVCFTESGNGVVVGMHWNIWESSGTKVFIDGPIICKLCK